MQYVTPKDWAKLQHYKDRMPPWLKLHRELLEDFDFHRLPVASRALAPMIWLLASEQKDGRLPLDYERIAFRLRMDGKELVAAVKPLIERGFLLLENDGASDLLAECLPRDRDRDRGRERDRGETDTGVPPDAPPSGDDDHPVPASSMPKGFTRFWSVWPSSPRKIGKAKCLEKWKRDGLEKQAAAICTHVDAMRRTRQWREGFEPAPITYLNQKRYQDEIPPDAPKPSPSNPTGAVREWWETAPGIEAKGKELGITQGEDEIFPNFKLRVYRAAGDGPWHKRLN